MRPLIVAANWKMNTTPAEAGRLASEIAAATDVAGVTRVICPPYVSLAAVASALAGSSAAVGAQNVHAEAMGAYTGEVSAPMLEGLASWCIVGHSERRRDQGEGDALVARKLLRCAEHGLRPILCVGEHLAEREAGSAAATVRGQLEATIAELRRHRAELPPDLVVAYEPVWAIGTGRTARGADAAEMANAIRAVLAEAGADADAIPVLYGGSVTSAAIDEFLAEPSIDGALVGGASLKVEEMAGIVARAGVVAAARQGARQGTTTV
ncbi:MAG TPA: triose-phosphate isomerase [Candidatus Limnocylindrales bacterium]|jgi:triosephosphate isomerase (TIM)|nr:triose-phosphate isomerase [Candidatus Limnocylindrales bacterium]